MAKKFKSIRELSVAELEKKQRDLLDELLQSRLSKQTGQLEKTHLLRELRRDKARVLTALQQKSSTVAKA